jgi:hypothetical protein
MEKTSLFLIVFIVFFSFSSNYALADIGPKPTVDFHITYVGREILNETFYAKMLGCGFKIKYEEVVKELPPFDAYSSESYDAWLSKCYEVVPKYNLSKDVCDELGIQKGMEDNISEYSGCSENGYNNGDPFCEKMIQKIPDHDKGCYWIVARLAWTSPCQKSTCHFSYQPPSEFRLEVYLPSQDKIFLSAPAKRENFYSNFEANLLSDGNITIKEVTPFVKGNSARNFRDFVIALIITLILETLTALIFVSIAKIPKKILLSVLFANLISLPIVWFVFPMFIKLPLTIVLGEIFAFIFEAYFIFLLNKKLITLKKSFIMSILMNLASLIIGGFFFLFMTRFLWMFG